MRDLVSRKYLHLKKHPLLSGEGNQAKDVLFIFNGMEKMKLDFRIGSTELCSDPNEPLPANVVVVNLLRKYLLPEVRRKTTTHGLKVHSQKYTHTLLLNKIFVVFFFVHSGQYLGFHQTLRCGSDPPEVRESLCTDLRLQ